MRPLVIVLLGVALGAFLIWLAVAVAKWLLIAGVVIAVAAVVYAAIAIRARTA